jgi:8-amino-7-oxononanoate synthase
VSLLADAARSFLHDRRSADLLRRRRVVTPVDGVRMQVDGRIVINFAGNDYFGLTRHPKMLAALQCSTAAGSGSAALISGYTDAHAAAEADLARWKGTEAALLLPSGYQANTAAVQTLAALGEAAGRPARFLVDKLAHASLIDAVRGSGNAFRVFPHNGIAKLDRLLTDSPAGVMNVVVTESVFSMDGDTADLASLADLKRRHDFVLLLDEAHGSGVYGQDGAGLAAEKNLTSIVDVTVVTLSKALGLAGGAICGGGAFADAVINAGRAYIYSTAVAPATASLVQTALSILRDEPDRQARLRATAAALRRRLAAGGLPVTAGDSPIVPIAVSDEAATLAAAASLFDRGFLVGAVRPPTVPRGTSRLRITISSEHDMQMIDQLVSAIFAVLPPRPI